MQPITFAVKNLVSLLSLVLFSSIIVAQQGNVGIGTNLPDASSVLEVKSDSLGVLIPRMTAANRDGISSPATGLLVFVNDDSTFYFYAGSSWVPIGNNSRTLSDADGDTKIQVEESPDEDQVRIDLGGVEYFRLDSGRIHVTNTGGSVFLGDSAGMNADLSKGNIFIGDRAGAQYKNSLLGGNIAIGDQSLYSWTNGSQNIAIGRKSLFMNVQGSNNVAIGLETLDSNKTGQGNVSLGNQSMRSNVSGDNNVVVGHRAGTNSLGHRNIFLGHKAGEFETADDRLYIESSDADSANALIYGEFDNDMLSVNGSLGIQTQTPTELLHVYGGNGVFDRGSETSVLTRSLRLGGVRSGNSAAYAQIDFFNYDSDSGADDYLGASIRSFNHNGNDAGNLAFYTADTAGSEEMGMVIQSGWVGAGITPQAALHVYGGGITNGSGGLVIENGDVANDKSLLYHNSDNDLIMRKENGTDQLVLDSGGKVGVGTNNPSGKLEVYTSGNNANSLFLKNDTVNIAQFGVNADIPLFLMRNMADEQMVRLSTDGDSYLLGGGLGIGTSSANAELQVFTSGNSTQSSLILEHGSVDALKVELSNGNPTLTMRNGIDAERVKISTFGDSYFLGGYLGIGTDVPSRALHVEDSETMGPVAIIDNTSTNSLAGGLDIKLGYTGPGMNNDFITFEDGNGQIGAVSGTGAGGAVLYNTTSDLRLKTDIRNYELGLNTVQSLRPVVYQRKASPGIDEIGLIAQELYEVLPQIVSGTPDNPIESPMMVDYSKLAPVLIAAIQEQQELIEKLEKRIERLEGEE